MFAKSRCFSCKLRELTLMAILCLSQTAFAQNRVDPLSVHTTQVALYSSSKGSMLSVRNVWVLEVSPVHTLLRFESVQDEIDLTDQQKIRIKESVEKAEFERKLALKRVMEKPQEAARILKDASREFEISVKDALLPTQLNTIDQIGIRIRMQLVGIESFLNGEEIFELSQFEQRRVSEVLGKHRKNVRAMAGQIKTKAFDKILQRLPSEKIEEVLSKFPQPEVNVSLLHLLAQLQHISKKKLEKVSKIESGLDVIKHLGQYSTAADGSFCLEPLYRGRLNPFIISPIIQSSSLFPEDVRNAVSQLEEKQEGIRNKNMERRAVLSSSGQPFDMELYREQERALQQEMVELCSNIVKGDQLVEPFIDACIETNVLSNGLIVELIEGPLSSRLGLNLSVRKTMRTSACEVYREIKREVSDLERELLAEVSEALEGRNRQLFSKFVDWRPKAICPDLYLLLRIPDTSNEAKPIFLEW